MATLAYTTPVVRQSTCANDNPPGPRPDKWRLLIDALRPIHEPLAVLVAETKLSGEMTFEEMCALIRTSCTKVR
jgi:hypothetical protein